LLKEAYDVLDGEYIENRYLHADYKTLVDDVAREPQFLSPGELQDISARLTEVGNPPSPEYYKQYFAALNDTKEKLVKANLTATPDEIASNNEAIKRIDKKIVSHAKDFHTYLSSFKDKTADINAYFIPEVVNGTFDWKSGVNPLNPTADASNAMANFSSGQAWKAMVQLLNHQICKVSVSERCINSTSERLDNVSYSSKLAKTVTLKDLEEANVVNFTEGRFRKDVTKIELNVGGERKEVDKATFFKLVVQHKQSLTNPKTMSILDYLRNLSPDMEKRYSKEVFAAQRSAFVDKLGLEIEQATQERKALVERLGVSNTYIKELSAVAVTNLAAIEIVIAEEMEKLPKGPNGKPIHMPVSLSNLIERQRFLQLEVKQLKDMGISLTASIDSLNATGEGSPLDNIKLASEKLTLLSSSAGDSLTINKINEVFKQTQRQLTGINSYFTQLEKGVAVIQVEAHVNDRVNTVKEYRQKVIHNDLQTNPEYRILADLAAGKMGTEKDRNPGMYAKYKD